MDANLRQSVDCSVTGLHTVYIDNCLDGCDSWLDGRHWPLARDEPLLRTKEPLLSSFGSIQSQGHNFTFSSFKATLHWRLVLVSNPKEGGNDLGLPSPLLTLDDRAVPSVAGAEKPILSRGTVGSRSVTAPDPPPGFHWRSRQPPRAVVGQRWMVERQGGGPAGGGEAS